MQTAKKGTPPLNMNKGQMPTCPYCGHVLVNVVITGVTPNQVLQWVCPGNHMGTIQEQT
jgi:hypothetical protein